MKLARLPTGHNLAFPPETDDMVVQSTVKRFMGVPAPAPEPVEEPDPGPSLEHLILEQQYAATKQMSAHLGSAVRQLERTAESLSQAVSQMADIAQRMGAALEGQARQFSVVLDNHAHQNAEAMTRISEAVGKMAAAVQAMRDDREDKSEVEAFKAIAGKIDGLSKDMRSGADRLVEAFTAPIVLTKDKDGRPTGMKRLTDV